MRTGLDLPNLVSELEYLHDNRRDFLVNTTSVTIVPPSTDDSIGVRFKHPNRAASNFPMTPHMLTQIANHTGVPTRLIDTILSTGKQREKEALCHMLTVRLQENEAIRLVRTQNRFYEEPVARAFVSDRYREIDHWPLLQELIPVFNNVPHMKLVSAQITDTHMYLKIVNLGPDMAQNIGKAFDTRGKEVDDILQFGVMVTNSEVGASAVRVTPFVYRLVCTNGLVSMQSLAQVKKNHIGKQIKGLSGSEVTSDGTSNAAFLAEVRTMVAEALNNAGVAKTIADQFKAAKKDNILGDPGAVMRNIGKTMNLAASEVKTMAQYLMSNGDLNRFGVVNAITQYAARNKSANYDRITEIEAIGGSVLNMGKALWKQFSVAIYTPEQIAEQNKRRGIATRAAE